MLKFMVNFTYLIYLGLDKGTKIVTGYIMDYGSNDSQRFATHRKSRVIVSLIVCLHM